MFLLLRRIKGLAMPQASLGTYETSKDAISSGMPKTLAVRERPGG
jgi:hypothetical protein